jgi:4-amino-4-deoxy-L-arabinose transferase-like glycosyltransferase
VDWQLGNVGMHREPTRIWWSDNYHTSLTAHSPHTLLLSFCHIIFFFLIFLAKYHHDYPSRPFFVTFLLPSCVFLSINQHRLHHYCVLHFIFIAMLLLLLLLLIPSLLLVNCHYYIRCLPLPIVRASFSRAHFVFASCVLLVSK